MPYWYPTAPDFPLATKIPMSLARAVVTNISPEMSTKTGIYHQENRDIVTAGLKVRPRLQSYAVANPQYNQTVIPAEAVVPGKARP